MNQWMRATCLSVLTLIAANTAATAQDSSPPSGVIPTPEGHDPNAPTRVSGSLPMLFERINEMDPILRAGLKASLLRQTQRQLPFVVIVDDAPSYLYAISQWENMLRFPVLWDDGRVETRENIARFVRSYKPESVFLLEDDGPWAFPDDLAIRQAQIERAFAKSLHEQSEEWQPTIQSIYAQGIVSPGIVLTDANEQAWAGALALSAGRFQPIGFMRRPSRITTPLEPDAANAIARETERLAAATGRSWQEVGDDIDAITLAMNTGTQIKIGAQPRDRIATSDRIGRRDHNGSGDRWAFCGQLIGTESQTVYRAMCALFLELDQAFIWDGYPASEPWDLYDGTAAADVLKTAELRVETHDLPRNTIRDWHLRQVRPIGDQRGEAGSSLLFLMNSKGAAHRFDLEGGRSEEGYAGDMPMLRVPTAMHIVHSFSLQRPFQRRTVGGRLLERGVYVYAGSVDEPFLNAFVPTPNIARRLGAGVAFGTAVRYDDGKVWKVAVLGDPLVTKGGAGQRIDAELAIDSMINLDTRSKERLKVGDYGGAMQDLMLLGRDEDVVRLANALIKDKPSAFTPDAAAASMPAMQREGDFIGMIDCYESLDTQGRKDGIMQDLLWLVSPYVLARGENDASLRARTEALLRDNIREGQEISDAERLAMQLRKRSLDAALGVMESVRDGLTVGQRRELDNAIRRVKR